MADTDVAPAPAPSLAQCLLSEAIGTFFLLSTVLFSPPEVLIYSVSVVLLVLVIALGNVSGTHINPAVTIGAIVVGGISVGKGIAYMIAQVVGAFLAVLVRQAFVGGAWPSVTPGVPGNAFVFELIGALLLVFIIIRVVLSGLNPAALGLAIGGALLAAIAIAGGQSGAVLNPALGLALLVGNIQAGAPANFLAYLVAPLLGGVIGAFLAKTLHPSAA